VWLNTVQRPFAISLECITLFPADRGTLGFVEWFCTFSKFLSKQDSERHLFVLEARQLFYLRPKSSFKKDHQAEINLSSQSIVIYTIGDKK